MKYQKFMKKVMEQLTEYKGTVDTLATSYLAEKAKFEKELQAMEGQYTSEYIEESRKNWNPRKDYAQEIGKAKEKHQRIASAYIDQIEKEMNSYFRTIVAPDFAATVTAIKILGVTLNNRELELLQGSAGGYMELRLLNELAVSRTKTEQRVELKNGEMKRTEKEAKIPYGGVELPDIEKMYDSLQNVKNSVNMAFDGYCGANYELKDVVFPVDRAQEERNASIAKAYGVQPQKPTLDTMEIVKMAGSVKCFDESYSTYTALSGMMGKLAATMPEPERKTVLTDDDKKLIDAVVDPKYPSLAESAAVKIAKTDSRLRELLLLDKRYSGAIKKELGEDVSDDK